MDIFISYSRKDEALVCKIQTTLEKAGITCWRDTINIIGSMHWRDKLIEGIDNSSIVLFMASKAAYESEFIENELYYALSIPKKVIYPYIIDDSTFADIPKRIRFALIKQNWRNIKELDFKTGLVNEILTLLGQPQPADILEWKSIHYANTDTDYEGECKDDVRHGKGTYYYANGKRYTGEFKNGLRHGEGTYYLPNGDYQKGKYALGKEQGDFHYYKKGERKPSKIITYERGEKINEHEL